MKNTKKRGFTIVELVVVIAVIAILASVLIPTFSDIVTKAKKTAALQDARNAYTQALVEHLDESTACGEGGHTIGTGENAWTVKFKSDGTATITGKVDKTDYTFTVGANGKITQTTPAENAGGGNNQSGGNNQG